MPAGLEDREGRREAVLGPRPGRPERRGGLRALRRVDSAVVAALLHKAIGKRLHCVFVDNGFQAGRTDLVDARFRRHFKVDLKVVDAEDGSCALEGVTDPGGRKTIGRIFIGSSSEAKRFRRAHFWPGTLPDVIESVAAFGGPRP